MKAILTDLRSSYVAIFHTCGDTTADLLIESITPYSLRPREQKAVLSSLVSALRTCMDFLFFFHTSIVPYHACDAVAQIDVLHNAELPQINTYTCSSSEPPAVHPRLWGVDSALVDSGVPTLTSRVFASGRALTNEM